MDFSIIEDDSILILPRISRNVIVSQMSKSYPFKRIKYMDKSELLEGLSYTYSKDAIYYLHNTYNLSFENAEETLNNLISKEGFNEKTKVSSDYYKELKDKKLIKINPYFKSLFNNKHVYIYNYSEYDLELKDALNKLDIKYEYIIDESKEYSHDVYLFDNMDKEVLFMFNKLVSLVKNQNVSLNDIFIYSYSSDYDLLIKKYAHYLNLSIEYEEDMYLIESPIYSNYIKLLSDHDYLDAYNILKEDTKYDQFSALNKIVDSIVSIKDLNLDKEDFIEFLNYIAKHQRLKKLRYKESIKIINDSMVVNDNQYIFMLGFSIDRYPIIHKDIDFYSDLEKEKLNLNTSKILNKIEEEKLIKFLKNNKNIFISYKKKIGNKVYFKSLLIEKLKLKEVTPLIDNIRYSDALAKIEVAKLKDLKKIYGITSNYINTYTKDELRYEMYDRRFKGLDDYYNDEYLKMSFSRINDYNECPFKYFLKRLVSSNIFEDSFSIELGNLFHLILEDVVKNNKKEINIDDYKDFIDEHFKTEKDKFFLESLLPQVYEANRKHQQFLENSAYTKALPEQEFEMQIDSNTSLYGKVDKILINEKAKRLLIVDYKTYSLSFKESNVDYGLDLQLPIYSILATNNYPDYLNQGIYIEQILYKKKDYLKDGANLFYMDGITLNDPSAIMNMDYTIDEENKSSNFFSGIKFNKDGTPSKSAKIKTEEELKDLRDKALNQIKIAIDNIRHARFNINPVREKGDEKDHTVCDYCKAFDICFMRPDDIKILKKDKEEE